MKVLHLGKLCPPNEGGIEVFTYDLLEYLNSKGIKADLLCFGDRTFEDDYRGFKYFSCKMNLKLSSAPLSIDFIKKFVKLAKNYDIIHVHSPNPLAEVLSIFSSKPLIIHWHSDIVKQRILYLFYKPIQQMLLKKANSIICTSPNYLDSSEQLKKFRHKVSIIPLSLNPERLIKKESNKEMKLAAIAENIKNKKIVLSIGRLVIHKGFEYLIEAGKYLDNDVVIIIIGDGPLYSKLKQKINDSSINHKVFLLGSVKVNEISKYIKICDIFCLPSIMESFGLVLLEAIYFGKPLITTDVYGSGMNYVNQNGITGFVVPPRNPIALAEAINKILGDANLYNNFSQNAKERFKEFEISNIGNRIIDLYKEILNRP